MNATRIDYMIARPHPQAATAYELYFHFSDGTEQRKDRGAYMLQPAQSHAKSYDVPPRHRAPSR